VANVGATGFELPSGRSRISILTPFTATQARRSDNTGGTSGDQAGATSADHTEARNTLVLLPSKLGRSRSYVDTRPAGGPWDRHPLGRSAERRRFSRALLVKHGRCPIEKSANEPTFLLTDRRLRFQIGPKSEARRVFLSIQSAPLHGEVNRDTNKLRRFCVNRRLRVWPRWSNSRCRTMPGWHGASQCR
jgi:hypothetical protein